MVGRELPRSSLVTSGVRPKLQALSTWNVHGPKQRPRCNPGVFTVLALLLILQHTPHTTYRLQQHVFPSARQSSRPRESGRGSSPFGPMRHSSEAVESSFHQALAPKRPRPESLGSLSAQSAHRECEEAFVGLVARLFGTIHAAAVSSLCPVTAHPLLLSAGRFRSTRMAIGNGNLADVTVAPR